MPACSLLALSSLLGPVAQDPCTLDAKLPLPIHQLPLEDQDDFGWAVDADGSRVVAGIRNYDGHGAVAVFGRTSGAWEVESLLVPPAPQGGEEFGSAVSIDADLLVVGAPSGAVGAAYVYRYSPASDQWALEDTVFSLANPGQFGKSVSADRDRIAVGEWGNAVVFRLVNQVWTVEDDTLPPPLADGGSYADDVSISGHLLLVVDDRYDPPPTSTQNKSGIAYTFHWNGTAWAHAATIRNPFPDADSDHFGEDADLDGTRAVIGCPRSDPDGVLQSGSAFAYELTSSGYVIQRQELDRGVGQENEIFGHAVAIRGTTAIVGAPEVMDGFLSSVGRAYQFDLVFCEWNLTAEFPHAPFQIGQFDKLGYSVALGDFAVAGAPNTGPVGNPGSAYVAVPCTP